MICKTNIPFEYKKMRGTLSPSLGVAYIRGLDGRFYTVEEWDSDIGADSVGFNYGFVMCVALNSVGEFQWSPNSNIYLDVPGLINYSDTDAALSDVSGLENTETIVSAFGENEDYAALACFNYIFPCGKRGYLPSYYEASQALRSSGVGLALAVAGGHSAGNSWSSTEGASNVAFSSYGLLEKQYTLEARPFYRL